MGDPKKPKKKYETPRHPWIKDVIDSEKALLREYGLANKKEVWRMKSLLSKFKALTKKYASLNTAQSEKEQELFLQKLRRIGILTSEQGLDHVLGLEMKDVMERRLQTIVYKKKMANSIKQARQFIVHNHILVDGKKVSMPSYIVKKEEEAGIEFVTGSSLFNTEHPEIVKISQKKEEVVEE